MKKHISDCVILSCLARPGLIRRFFRRYYFRRLNKKIERLPEVVKKLGQSYSASHKSFFVL